MVFYTCTGMRIQYSRLINISVHLNKSSLTLSPKESMFGYVKSFRTRKLPAISRYECLHEPMRWWARCRYYYVRSEKSALFFSFNVQCTLPWYILPSLHRHCLWAASYDYISARLQLPFFRHLISSQVFFNIWED